MNKINLPEWDAPLCPEVNNVLNKRDIDTIRYKSFLLHIIAYEDCAYDLMSNYQMCVLESELEGKTIMQAASLVNESVEEDNVNNTEWWLQRMLCDIYPDKYQAV